MGQRHRWAREAAQSSASRAEPGRARSQRGIGALGIMFWLILAVGALTVGLRLGPAYMEYLTVKSVMEGVREDPSAAGAPRNMLLSTINRRLYINQVSTVKPSHFTFERAAEGGTDVTVQYEVRRPVAFNIDAVMMFEHTVTMPPK